MKVKCTMKGQALRQLSRAQAMAIAQTAQEMLNQTRLEQTIPFDTGTLQNESTYVDDNAATAGKVSIVSDTPYARKLYFHPEYNFSQDKNANAKGEWWEDWITGGLKGRPKELFRKLYRRLTGGWVK